MSSAFTTMLRMPGLSRQTSPPDRTSSFRLHFPNPARSRFFRLAHLDFYGAGQLVVSQSSEDSALFIATTKRPGVSRLRVVSFAPTALPDPQLLYRSSPHQRHPGWRINAKASFTSSP